MRKYFYLYTAIDNHSSWSSRGVTAITDVSYLNFKLILKRASSERRYYTPLMIKKDL